MIDISLLVFFHILLRFPSVHIHSQFLIGQTMGTEMKNAFFGKCFLPKKVHTRRINFFSRRRRCFLRAIFESRRNTLCIARLSKEAIRKQIGCRGKKGNQECARIKGDIYYEEQQSDQRSSYLVRPWTSSKCLSSFCGWCQPAKRLQRLTDLP